MEEKRKYSVLRTIAGNGAILFAVAVFLSGLTWIFYRTWRNAAAGEIANLSKDETKADQLKEVEKHHEDFVRKAKMYGWISIISLVLLIISVATLIIVMTIHSREDDKRRELAKKEKSKSFSEKYFSKK